MSKVSHSILSKIEHTLDDIESSLATFQNMSMEAEQPELGKLNTSSKLQYGLKRTDNLYSMVSYAGSFPTTYHAHQTNDAMCKWSVQIDDLYWALFGCEQDREELESNRMKVIHNKLKQINALLRDYTPSKC
jgi:hypothetical protein